MSGGETAAQDDGDPPPSPPLRPEDGDCCRGSCDPCVFDLYDAAIERYHEQLAAWQERHGAAPDAKIPPVRGA